MMKEICSSQSAKANCRSNKGTTTVILFPAAEDAVALYTYTEMEWIKHSVLRSDLFPSALAVIVLTASSIMAKSSKSSANSTCLTCVLNLGQV